MQLVRISDGISDIVDGQRSQFQQLRGFGHAVAEQELLRGLSDGIFEDPAEIGPVQSAEGGDAFNGYNSVLYNSMLLLYKNRASARLRIFSWMLPTVSESQGTDRDDRSG